MPNDPDFSPFRDLAAALMVFADDIEPREKWAVDELGDKARALLRALQPFTPAQLDAMLWPIVDVARKCGSPDTQAPRADRLWIRLEDGTALPADARDGGTHVWDKDGHEWVAITPESGEWLWRDPRKVYRVLEHGPRCRDPHCRDCGPRTLGGLAAGQSLRVDPRIGM